MTTLLIKITPEVLERAKMCGTENTGENCAIAIAVRDIFPTAWVSNDTISPFDGNICEDSRFDIPLPDVAQSFISNFDRLTPDQRVLLEEFSFTVTLPDEVVERIDISSIMGSKTLELV